MTKDFKQVRKQGDAHSLSLSTVPKWGLSENDVSGPSLLLLETNSLLHKKEEEAKLS